MASSSQVKRYQDELKGLRSQLARESAKIGPAHGKAARARADAAKARSASTQRSKLTEADREDKKAHAAEIARAGIETKIARAEAHLIDAQRRYTTETERDNKRALDNLASTVKTRERQFHPTRSTLARSYGDPSAERFTAETDVFISHASEDKEGLVRPLQQYLAARKVTTWLDELNIGWGTSIRQSIDAGIANCRFGLVVISPHFMTKPWTNAELDALFGRQLGEFSNGGFILPVWHHVSADDVQRNMPTVAGLKALNTSLFTIEQIADEVAKLVHAD